MLPYIITFAVSLTLIWLSQITKKKNKIISGILLVLGLVVPCLLAALRDEKIGTDTLVYQKPFFSLAKHYPKFFSSPGFVEYIDVISTHDYLYYFLTWLCARITSHVGIVYFINELLIILPLYVALEINKKDDKDVLLGMLIFYFLWYDLSLNMIRQGIAVSFSLLAIVLYEKKNYKQSIMTLTIASLFHNSALIVFPILALYNFIRGNDKTRKKTAIIIAIVLLFAVVSFNLKGILSCLSNIIGTFAGFGRYVDYVNKYSSGGFKWKQLTMWVIYLIIYLFSAKNMKKHTNNYYFYLTILVISLFGFYTETVIQYTHRFFIYFGYPFLYLIVPKMPYCFKEKWKKILMLLFIILISISFWVSSSAIGNGNKTMPYKFSVRN